jgi:hypothetical protein
MNRCMGVACWKELVVRAAIVAVARWLAKTTGESDAIARSQEDEHLPKIDRLAARQSIPN